MDAASDQHLAALLLMKRCFEMPWQRQVTFSAGCPWFPQNKLPGTLLMWGLPGAAVAAAQLPCLLCAAAAPSEHPLFSLVGG